jgi:type IV secretion system protein TrbI
MGEEGVKPMSADEGMSPTESPDVLSKTTGVRRVNNLPVYLIGGVLTAFLIVMTLVAAERVKQQNIVPVAKEGVAGNTTMFANEIVGSLKDGIVQANKPAQFMPPPLPDSPPIPIARLSNLDAPPSPPSFQTNSKPNDDLERIRLAKMQQLEEAIKAKTSVHFMAIAKQESPDLAPGYNQNVSDETVAKLEAVRQEISRNNQPSTEPNKAYQDRMQALQSGSYGGGQRLLPDDDPSARQQAGYEQFANTDKGDRWKLDSQPEAPRTPYELRAGYVIPAIMIYGINSSLPGQIVGQVSQDVYDTATHRWKLIPQGSRLVGTYSSEVEYGQARVLVAWQRIIFPDGKAMDIGTMPGSDGEGYSGFTDQVNNHYARLYGSAFLLSAMTAGFTLSQNQNQTNQGAGYGYQQNASTTLSQALGQQLGQVTGRLMQKNINISPTLEIRPGYRFNVVVTKDMTFSKPYQSFDY